MKLTTGVEQAICIIVLLSTQDSRSPLASDEISKKLDVSPSYLKKIIRKLVVKQIVTSVSGNNGGISLAKEPQYITALDIIEAMEGPISIFSDSGLIAKVFKDGKYSKKGTATLLSVFDGANHLLRDYFSKITTADLLKEIMEQSGLPELDWNTTSLADFLKKEMKHDENA
ncbi:Rrf2 family protein [Paenibacillus sp. DS2015]|uniref:RrF2 family transcriptional regulator n=1 Tax=Paenibacillus sp. DS2015 TaxID=3373917 RepID=UPI003D24EE68